MTDKLNLVCDNKNSFREYRSYKRYSGFSFITKYDKWKIVYENAANLYVN